LQLRNRIAIPWRSQYFVEDGKVTEGHMIHLGYLAFSGTGLMILEASRTKPILAMGFFSSEFSGDCTVGLVCEWQT
jgi:2,4-dienoyl-CoA reductase-like NADH-dependent reductase (Old Yellow Enzyme family)